MNSKWELVLIDWVNCLKLGRHIDNLESLQDGEFLINFMNAILNVQLTRAKLISEIEIFIKTEYPALNFNLSLPSNSISELTSIEFAYLLSILMHHSCVVNQRDFVTSSMCFHISKQYQIYIKRFLEEINISTGDINLHDIINKCVSTDENCTFNQWVSSSGDSPLCSRTPLKEYLQTPFKTTVVREKEQEIKKLRTCLELKSFEKTDLLEELKEHKENVEQLKYQLKKKSQDVSKLRNELFNAEKQTSPFSAKKKSDLNRQLRSEIANLEKYTQQLQQEQEELQMEKASSNKKLKKAETELKIASEKIYSLELVCDQLTDKHREQQQELETLRSNCTELNILLTELRSQSNLNNSSLNSSKRTSCNWNNTTNCEDLACSVVEVQLRDAQEEINTLKDELNQFIGLNNNLNEEMHKLQIDFNDLTKKYENSEENNLKLTVNCDDLKVSLVDLRDTREEVLNIISNEKNLLTVEVQQLAEVNSDLTVKLQQTISDVFILQQKLAESQSNEAFVKNVNELTSKQNDSLRSESAHLQLLLNQNISKLTESSCKINVLEAAFDELDAKFYNNLKNLELSLFGVSEKNYSDKNHVFEELLVEIHDKNRREFDDKEELRVKLGEFQLDIDDLVRKVDDLKLKELADFEFSSRLQDSLKQAAIKVEILDKSIVDKDVVIEKLKLDVLAMNKTADSLECLKNQLIQRENQHKIIADNLIKDLRSINNSLETRTNKTAEEINYGEEILGNNDDLLEVKRNSDENTNELLIEINKNIHSLLVDLDIKNSDLKTSEKQLKIKDDELVEIKLAYFEVRNEFDSNKCELLAKIDLLDDSKSKLQQELDKQMQTNKLTDKKLEKLTKNFEKLTKKQRSLATKSESLQNDVKSLSDQLIAIDKLCVDKDDVLARANQELLTNKLLFESKKQLVADLKQKLGVCHSEMSGVKAEMALLKENGDSAQIKVDILEQEVKIMLEVRDGLVKKNSELEGNYLKTIEQLKLKNDDYNACVDDIKKSRAKMEGEIISLSTHLAQCNKQLVDLTDKSDYTSKKHDLDIKSLIQQKNTLKQLIFNLQIKEKEYIEDIKLIKSNLTNVIRTYLQSAKQNKQFSSEELIKLDNTEDLVGIFDKLKVIFNYLLQQTVSLEISDEKHKLNEINYREREEDNLDAIKNLTADKKIHEISLVSKDDLIRKLHEKIELLKHNFTKEQEDNRLISDSKQTDVLNLLNQLTDLKQISTKQLVDKEIATNELNTLQINYKQLQESFAISEKNNDSKVGLINQVEKDTENKLKLFSEQFDLLAKRCDKLDCNSSVLKKTFEHSKIDKIKLEQALVQQEGIIEDLRSTVDFADSKLKDLEVDLCGKVLEISAASEKIVGLTGKLLEVEVALANVIRERDALVELKLTSEQVEITRVHENSMQIHKEMKERLFDSSANELNYKQMLKDIQIALDDEKSAKRALEKRILHLQNDNVSLLQIKLKYKSFLTKISGEFGEVINPQLNDGVVLEELSNQVELQIVEVIKSNRDLARVISDLQQGLKTRQNKISTLEEVQVNLSIEKEDLLLKFNSNQRNEQNFEALLVDYDLLKAKYEQYKNYCQDNEKTRNDKNKSIIDNYSKFRQKYLKYKIELESVIKNRNSIEAIINCLNDKLAILQLKSNFINEETYKTCFEKRKILEVISVDLQKQFLRSSKIIYNTFLTLNNTFDVTTNKIIIDDKLVNLNDQLFDHEILLDTTRKLEEIKELAEDAIQRVNAFIIPEVKAGSTLKESNTNEDLRKKFTTIKQKLILVENAKNNFERKIRILREENLKLKQIENMDSNVHYTTLLQQHMDTKEEQEKLITECDNKYKQLLSDFAQYKKEHPNDQQTSQDRSVKLEKEVRKIRDAYGNLMSDKSKLELENVTVKKLLEDRNGKIGDLMVVKEAYEKLLEDNNKLSTDVDTLMYKRTRDREEFVRILKNEKDEYENREGKRVQDIRNEYELKLEKMKDKMVRLYKEEVDKEMHKVLSEKSNNTTLMETIEHLRDELTDAQLKHQLLETERSSILEQLHRAQQFTNSIPTYHLTTTDHLLPVHPSQNKHTDSKLTTTFAELSSVLKDRRCATMPRSCGGLDVLEEIRIHKRLSISANSGNARGLVQANADLQMEDEDDMFNNKYLVDLKEGRCNFAVAKKESADSRMSELAYRNSMCLPHLKSSYPCETQFANPSVFKEDDIKLGANTYTTTAKHSTHMPPAHPPLRMRKDAGTTSYKRPGPPTPSKNGGRTSLNSADRAQGIILPLREVNDGRSSIAHSVVQQARNRLTPTRLKALFSGKGRAVGGGGGATSTVENQGSPKGKRLSIFKKPR